MTYQKENAGGGNHTAQIKSCNKYSKTKRSQQLNFSEINRAALSTLPVLLSRWLPDGQLYGREYAARNPKRADNRAGSFRINIQTGKWADFATGDQGGDIISLAAYLSGKGQYEAARELAAMLGVYHDR